MNDDDRELKELLGDFKKDLVRQMFEEALEEASRSFHEKNALRG